MKTKYIFLWIILPFLLSDFVFSQSLEANVTMLTNGNYQIWTYEYSEGNVGTESCNNLFVFRFQKYPQVGEKYECEGKKSIKKGFTWEITENNGYIYIVNLKYMNTEEIYEIDFVYDEENRLILRLKDLLGTRQSEENEVKNFRRE